MEIRRVKENEISKALDLTWRTFLEYEAPDYTKVGIKESKKNSTYALMEFSDVLKSSL